MCVLRSGSFCAAFALAAASLFSVPASAAPVDLLPNNPLLGIYLKSFPSGLDEDKVYLQTNQGTTVLGNVGSQNGSPVVTFTSSSLLNPANGFANIKGVSGDYFSLMVSVPGYVFGDLMFDTQIDKGPNKTLNLTITAFNNDTQLGTLTLSQLTDLKKRADQSWLVIAEGAAVITSVLIQSTTGLFETKHFQLSELSLIPNPVPEPSPTPIPGAAWLMGSVLAGGTGFGAWRRRRRLQSKCREFLLRYATHLARRPSGFVKGR